MSRPPAALKITCTRIIISMHIIMNTKTRTQPFTEGGIHMVVLLRWYAYPVSYFQCPNNPTWSFDQMPTECFPWPHAWVIYAWFILPENICNLRGETSETPLEISDRVRTFSGVPLIVSLTKRPLSPISFHLHVCRISFQSCPRPRASHNAVTEDLDFVCCKDSKYKDPWPDAWGLYLWNFRLKSNKIW